MATPSEVIFTFARRKKSGDRANKSSEETKPQKNLVTPEPKLDKQATLITPTEDTIPARWRRKKAPANQNQKQEAQRQAYLAEIKQHFAELEAFELAVETPTPPGKMIAVHHRYGWEGADKPRSMSFGLSTRQTSIVTPRLCSILKNSSSAPSPSPLRISLGPKARTSILSSLPEAQSLNFEVVADEKSMPGDINNNNGGIINRSGSVVGRRSSAASKMLGRLSLRISDALGKISRRSGLPNLPEVTEEENTQNDGCDYVLSPVAERAEAEDTVALLIEKLEAELKLDTNTKNSVYGEEDAFSLLSPLEQLLTLCGQEGQMSNLPTMEDLLGRHVDLTAIKKIGEGTFGEAFRAENVVLKIVPLEGTLLVNGEPQKRAEEILAEVAITLTLSGLRNNSNTAKNATSGFVETHGVGICQGKYAPALSREWHRWNGLHRSENESVDIFDNDQLFVVFVVADGGLDLEHFQPRSFEEIRSILMQVTMTLAVAEEACQFEHRDLHWGNLLVSRDSKTDRIPYRFRDVDIIVETSGLCVTLIDFTLSRLTTPEGEVAFCDLVTDPQLFNGPKGNVQADTYRKMQKATKNDWQQYNPITNALWLQYLADIMIDHKLPEKCSAEDRAILKSFRKATAAAKCAGDLVWSDMFSGKWTTSSSSSLSTT